MSGLVGQTDQGNGLILQLITTPTWTIDASDIKTVRVNNISLAVLKRDIEEFFSFSGDIQYVELRSESESTQLAYVTFKDTQGADTAILLSGAVIGNFPVSITPVDDYVLPPEVLASLERSAAGTANPGVKKAEDVVSSMLAKGFILGKDAVKKARELDERHHLVAGASAAVASIDGRIGLSEKLSLGRAAVNERVREVDEKYQVSEKTRSALADAGSAIMANPYVMSGASWVSSAFTVISKAAGDVGVMTMEKVERAQEERKETLYRERTGIIADFAQVHLDESLPRGPPVVPVSSADDDAKKPALV